MDHHRNRPERWGHRSPSLALRTSRPAKRAGSALWSPAGSNGRGRGQRRVPACQPAGPRSALHTGHIVKLGEYVIIKCRGSQQSGTRAHGSGTSAPATSLPELHLRQLAPEPQLPQNPELCLPGSGTSAPHRSVRNFTYPRIRSGTSPAAVRTGTSGASFRNFQ